jgi:hypothetical protein
MYRFQKTKCSHKEGSYPLSFTNEVLNIIIGYEAYFFLDGCLGYHEISIALKDRY